MDSHQNLIAFDRCVRDLKERLAREGLAMSKLWRAVRDNVRKTLPKERRASCTVMLRARYYRNILLIEWQHGYMMKEDGKLRIRYKPIATVDGAYPLDALVAEAPAEFRGIVSAMEARAAELRGAWQAATKLGELIRCGLKPLIALQAFVPALSYWPAALTEPVPSHFGKQDLERLAGAEETLQYILREMDREVCRLRERVAREALALSPYWRAARNGIQERRRHSHGEGCALLVNTRYYRNTLAIDWQECHWMRTASGGRYRGYKPVKKFKGTYPLVRLRAKQPIEFHSDIAEVEKRAGQLRLAWKTVRKLAGKLTEAMPRLALPGFEPAEHFWPAGLPAEVPSHLPKTKKLPIPAEAKDEAEDPNAEGAVPWYERPLD